MCVDRKKETDYKMYLRKSNKFCLCKKENLFNFCKLVNVINLRSKFKENETEKNGKNRRY